ncbi:discoidin domain-containing protein [Streptomyces sp. NPDC051976]|uniref:discoidin domain-containing protein n=1 Tax=Streptomyces sp. NPDC051976 TaxID=3154947 RepID=UPI003428777E
MPLPRRLIGTLVTTLLACAALPALPARAAVSPSVWVQDSDDRPFTSSTPPAGAATAVSLYAARDDYEAAQLLVRSGGSLSGASVTTGALAGPGGAAIPAGDISVRREYNHPSVQKIGSANTVENPPDGGSAYYDALMDNAPQSAGANTTLAYYYQVHVPDGQAPGTYSGSAVVNTSAGNVTVPVSVTVYSATIPPTDQSSFKMNNWFTSAGWDYTGTVQAIPLQYGVQMYDANWWKVIGNIATDMAAHRNNVVYADFQALLIPGTTIDASGAYHFDWSDFDRFVQLFVDAGAMQYLYTPTLLEGNPDGNSPGLETLVAANGTSGAVKRVLCKPNSAAAGSCPDTNAYLRTLFPALKAHLDAKGWTDRFYMSALDEPSTQAQSDASNWLYDTYKSSFPHPLTNEAHNSLFTGNAADLTTQTPVTSDYDAHPAWYQSQRLAGKDLWFYTCIIPQGDYMNRFISNHLDATRLLPWLAFKTAADGYLHWGWNYWVNNVNGTWQAADTFNGSQSGDAWLVRPNKAAYGIYDSLRSESQLSGLQDYELLNILARTKPVAAHALAETMITDLTHFDTSGTDVVQRHKQLLDEIAAGGPDASFPFTDDFTTSGDEHNWRHSKGSWSVSGGSYTQSSTAAEWGDTSAVEGRAYGDVAASVDLRITGTAADGGSGNWAGLMVRSMNGSDMDTGYLIAQRDNGQLFVYRGGTTLGSATVPGYVAGQTTHLRVVAKGGRLSVYSGTSQSPALTVDDSAYGVGDIALVTGGASAVFDNVRINPMANAAEGATITASSSYDADGWGKDALADGRRGSVPGALGWSSGSSLATDHTEWVQADLGSVKPLSRVDLYPRDDSGNAGNGFPTDFTIQVSADGTTWTTVADRTGYPKPSGAQTFPFATTSARYVRVTGTRLRTDSFGNYHMQLAELEATGGDLALGRTVSASSSVEYPNESWLRSDLTDGVHLSNLWYSMGYSSAGASTQHTEWAQVDLGGPSRVSQVALWPRTDGTNTGRGFPVDFAVQTSPDGVTWTTVASRTGYAPPDATAQTFGFAATTARYVRITGTKLSTDQTGTYYLQLGELEVS